MRDIKLISIVCFLLVLIACNNDFKFPEGGYKYPANLQQKTKDSFKLAYYADYWRQAFNEENLAIKPQREIIFRLSYETAFGESSVFTMTPNEIVVKQALEGNPYPDYDTSKLNPLERQHFRILRKIFPIQDIDSSNPRKIKADSLARIYPKLLDPKYYKYLLDKSAFMDSTPFKYSVKKIKISDSTYSSIVNQINSSGYWSMPLLIYCPVMDGYGFILEANTLKQYNFVGLSNCPEKAAAFSKACQALIDAAKPDKPVKVYGFD